MKEVVTLAIVGVAQAEGEKVIGHEGEEGKENV